jgi:hypothetical protein
MLIVRRLPAGCLIKRVATGLAIDPATVHNRPPYTATVHKRRNRFDTEAAAMV